MTITKYNVYIIRITELVLIEKHKYWTVVSLTLYWVLRNYTSAVW